MVIGKQKISNKA